MTVSLGDTFDKYILQYSEQNIPILEQADMLGVGADFVKKRRRVLGLVKNPRKKVDNQ